VALEGGKKPPTIRDRRFLLKIIRMGDVRKHREKGFEHNDSRVGEPEGEKKARVRRDLR